MAQNGGMKFGVNYRALNNIAKKDLYPIRRIDDTLYKIYGKTASGYFQITLIESTKELTAFIVENSLCEFNRMLFGLTNAPGTFHFN